MTVVHDVLTRAIARWESLAEEERTNLARLQASVSEAKNAIVKKESEILELKAALDALPR